MLERFIVPVNPTIVFVELKSTPKLLPITLKEVKSFLRIENTQDDEIILYLIAMATDYAKWYMEKSLVKQKWQASCEGYIPRRIYLNYGPIREIISVATTVFHNKEERKLEYYFSNVGNYIEFYNCLNVQKVDVIYEAGYDNVPNQIKLEIIQHVTALYKNRELEVGSHLSEIKKVYSPFRDLKVLL